MRYRKICKKIHADTLEFLSWYVNIHFTNKWKRVKSQKSVLGVRKARSKPEKRNQAAKRTAKCHRTACRSVVLRGLPSQMCRVTHSKPRPPAPSAELLGAPGNRNGVQGSARPNKKEQSPIPYTVRSIVLSAIFAARCLLCVTAMTAMFRFSASARTRFQICACVITSSIVLISSQIR